MYMIKQFAAMSGITIKALRHYEKIGLLVPSKRDENNYRVYTKADAEKLQNIIYLKAFDFTLNQIKQMLNSPVEKRERLLLSQLEKINQSAARYDNMLRIAKTKLLQTTELKFEDDSRVISAIATSKKSNKIGVLVCGMQNDFINGSLANERISFIVPKIQQFVKTARKSKIPVIHLCDNHLKGLHHELDIWGDHAIAGTKGAEIIKELTPKEKDYIVYKHYYSGFYQTELRSLLTKLNIDTLIVTGIHLHICILHTIIDAFNLGFSIIVATDAVESFSQEQFDFGIKLLKESYSVQLLGTEEIAQNYFTPKKI